MPPSKNPLLTNNFNKGPSGKYQVQHCKRTRTNTRRALEHLENCANYAASRTVEQLAKRQATLQLGVQTISREKKQKLDSAAALAVYMSAKPFCLWEDKYFRRLISLLSDNLYTPPRSVVGLTLGKQLGVSWKGVWSGDLREAPRAPTRVA